MKSLQFNSNLTIKIQAKIVRMKFGEHTSIFPTRYEHVCPTLMKYDCTSKKYLRNSR